MQVVWDSREERAGRAQLAWLNVQSSAAARCVPLPGAHFGARSRTGLFSSSMHVLGVVIRVFTALLIMTLLVFLL